MPTIMVRHATDDQIQLAMSMTGRNTASKAMVDCIDQLSELRSRHQDLQTTANRLEAELRLAKRALANAKESAAGLLVAIDQLDEGTDDGGQP